MLHPTEKYYPLRPELAESTFYLYQATKGLIIFVSVIFNFGFTWQSKIFFHINFVLSFFFFFEDVMLI